MNKRKIVILAASGIAVISSSASYAATQLDFTTPVVTSNDAASLNSAFKTKLVRTTSGMLITAYGDARDATKVVYDVKGQVERPARDIFVRSCDANTVDCSDEANWSAETNISNTAALTSIQTDWTGTSDGLTTRTDFWGDSDKPNIVNAGTRVQLTWVDKYCPILAPNVAVEQRTVTYLTLESREIPFSCVYVANSDDNGLTWSTEKQLTDGSRDAKQDASKTASDGHAIITWQEDPLGLLRGDGDGPGDGASGAKVSHATEIWHTTTGPWAAGGSPTWAAPVALTDNQTTGTATGNHDDIKDAAGVIVADNNIDGGLTGSSRANVALVGTTAIVAYEETKNSDGLDEGKYVRYHSFTYNAGGTDNAGCIISNPVENARRVRFVTQMPPGGAGSNTTMGIFWKEGNYDQGGPSDIMIRRGVTDFTTANMIPAVDATCETSDYATATALVNAPAVNLSSETHTATAANLTDTSEANNIENALAHRALLRGDDLYVGYSYTPDWGLTTYTTLGNYNFWLRKYDGTTDTWTNPVNLTNISDTTINAREPRLVGTPSGAGQNASAFIVAWGTQTNVPEHLGGAEDLEIYYTRTFDKGVTFEPVVTVANPTSDARFESQLRPSQDAETLYAAWNQESASGTNAMFSIGTSITAPTPAPAPVASSGGGGGCTYNSEAKLDPTLPALLLLALGYLGLRRQKREE